MFTDSVCLDHLPAPSTFSEFLDIFYQYMKIDHSHGPRGIFIHSYFCLVANKP
jgi:hypothetical protein